MYKSIYVPVDNSDHSNACERLGVALASHFGAKVVGSHVYAAKLHDVRFKQMEFTLPEEYKEETELEKQRRIHDALIARGLQLISDSYLDRLDRMCQAAGLPFERLMSDGRNFEEIVREVNAGAYDLVVIGALGQGAVKHSQVGSVCERTLRRTCTDTLVVRAPDSAALDADGALVVALDGSGWSWGALRAAMALAAAHARAIEIIAVQTPDSQTEALIEAHLRLARTAVRARGLKVRTTLLDGQPAEAIREHLEERETWAVVVGRAGLDADADSPELGSVTSYLVRTAPCNVLVTSRQWTPSDAAATASV